MKMHNPYCSILEDLGTVNGCYDEKYLRELLQSCRPDVQSLRKAYKKSPCKVDFSNPATRRAYLLAYYPHYIELLYFALESSPAKCLDSIFSHQSLQACFIGAGPAPEALGWAAYLNDHYPGALQATAYLLDLYSAPWQTTLKLTTKRLAPVYWPSGQLHFEPLRFDLWQPVAKIDARLQSIIQSSHFFVMQNCLNDVISNKKLLLDNFLNLYNLTPPGSIFVIVDLNFDDVFNFIAKVEKSVEDCAGEVVKSINASGLIELKSSIEYPAILKEELFTGEDGLVAKKNIRFYFSVLCRNTTSIQPILATGTKPTAPSPAAPVNVHPKPHQVAHKKKSVLRSRAFLIFLIVIFSLVILGSIALFLALYLSNSIL